MRQVVVVSLLVGPVCALLAPAGDRPKADGLAKPVPVEVDGKPLVREGGGLFPFVGDFYGDGRQALLLGTVEKEGRLLIYRNVGTKTSPRLAAPLWFDDTVPTGRIPIGWWGPTWFRPQLVDFDGKGRLDLLSGSNRHDAAGFHLFRRKEDGSWAPRKRLEVAYPGKPFIMYHESFVRAIDWTGDGAPDLLCVRPHGEGILAALGPFKENEPIALSHVIDFTPKGHVWDFAVADWDRDGKPDLLVRQSLPDHAGKQGIYWYKNLGGAGLPKLAEGKLLVGEKALVGEDSSDVRVSGFSVCDWNGDGWPDLIVTRNEPPRRSVEGRPLAWRGTVWLYLRE